MLENRFLPLSFLVASLLLGGCALPFGRSNYSGIQINAEPKAAVYIDDKHVGETDYYDTKIKADDHVVKLALLEGDGASWETKVKLLSGLTTVIKRTFGNTPQESSDYVIQLEKISNKKTAELTIVTTPENVIVRLDDQPKGFSPLNNIGITPVAHKVTLSAPGYKTEDITINPVLGYRLLLNAELGKSLSLQPSLTGPSASASAVASTAPAGGSTPSATPSAKPTSTPKPSSTPKPTPTPKPSPTSKASATPAASPTPALQKPYVEILSTPTGWLRVRSEPNGIVDNEVARVNSGQSFPFIEANDTGWYKIEYASGKQGWIVSTYANLVR